MLGTHCRLPARASARQSSGCSTRLGPAAAAHPQPGGGRAASSVALHRLGALQHGGRVCSQRRLLVQTAAKGFGKKIDIAATAGDDVYSGEDGWEWFLFARRSSGKWLPLGDVTLAPDADVALALEQRFAAIKKHALKKHPAALAGSGFELGFRFQKGRRPRGDDMLEITAVQAPAADAPPAATVPARLRLLEDEKTVGKRLRQAMLADSFADAMRPQFQGSGGGAVRAPAAPVHGQVTVDGGGGAVEQS